MPVDFHIQEQKRLGLPPLRNPYRFASVMDSTTWKAMIDGPSFAVWIAHRRVVDGWGDDVRPQDAYDETLGG